jgi:hypothetical protein
MAEKRNLRGLTRIDALVAGVACLVLVLLVPVLLGKPRERSIRTVCAANLAQIGKTMFVYANDNDDALPRAGGPTTLWGLTPNWAGFSRQQAFGVAPDSSGGRASINSCFYLLVKYYQAPTRLFLCRGDKGTTEFKLSDIPVPRSNFALADAWDFGPASVSYKSCSFSYHHPYNQYFLTTSRDPNLAVAADRNPWVISPGAEPAAFALFIPDLTSAGNSQSARAGNAATHGKDGQNVLFLDGRVVFETRAYCGVKKDNIYTTSGLSTGGSSKGIAPMIMTAPQSDGDSFLVHDPDGGSPYYPSRER